MDVSSTPGISSPHAPASAPAFPLTDPVFAFPPPAQIFKLPPGLLSPIPLQPAPKRISSDRFVSFLFYTVLAMWNTFHYVYKGALSHCKKHRFISTSCIGTLCPLFAHCRSLFNLLMHSEFVYISGLSPTLLPTLPQTPLPTLPRTPPLLQSTELSTKTSSLAYKRTVSTLLV